MGKSDVELSRLGLGCAPLGNLYAPVSDDDAHATVVAAVAAGLTFFDTAPLYGSGLSEERLGRSLNMLEIDRASLTVSTKVGRLLVPGTDQRGIFAEAPPMHATFDFSRDGVHRSLESSLERLGLDRVDVVLVHDPDDHAEQSIEESFPALLELRDEGVVRAVGAGMNQGDLLARFVREVDLDCVLIAGRWTLLDRSGMTLLDLCNDRDVGVVAGGVFNSGLLADPDSPTATFDYSAAPPRLVERARRLRDVCARHGVPLTAAALQFPYRHPAVSAVVVGARSAKEIESNIEAVAVPIPEELWQELAIA